jgi:four helix bundle protein
MVVSRRVCHDRGSVRPSRGEQRFPGGYDSRPLTQNHRPWTNGTRFARAACMKAKNLDDVVVYKEALVAEDEVSAFLERPSFSKDLNTKSQLDRSSSRVAPLIAEGFGQLTDRHLATYLARARGSASETRTHLRKARRKKFISAEEHDGLSAKYTTIGKRLSRWIHYLEESDWDNRG